jgi:nitrogen regulatory protein P-II 1
LLAARVAPTGIGTRFGLHYNSHSSGRTTGTEPQIGPAIGLFFYSGRTKFLMKLIIAIIQPSKLEDVKAALSEVEVVRLTIMDVQGFGRQKGQTEVYRGHEITVNLLRKVQLMIAVNDHFVEPTINAIIKGGRTGPTGEIGDGKIFVLPLEDCIRIRTGERGSEAI